MKHKLSPKQLELYRFVDKLLLTEWDPIGVKEEPMAKDEYENYVPQIFSLVVINGCNIEELEEHLFRIETDQMGLPGNRQQCLNIAEIIINKKTELGL